MCSQIFNLCVHGRHKALLEYIQPLLSAQLPVEQHHQGCTDQNHYTIHSQRNRHLQGLLGTRETIPICRVRCQSCRAVFTVLPSFILRYRRQDADCLGKLLEMNLGMGLTLRETATLYSWMGIEHGWQPGWIWNLVQWLGNLLPVFLLLMRMGLSPPKHLLSDEKFAVLNAEQVNLFLVSEQELIWYGKSMTTIDEDSFTQTIETFCVGMDGAARASEYLEAEDEYVPISVTTDGWIAAQNAWVAVVSSVSLIECKLHGNKRVSCSLDEYVKAHPDLPSEQLEQVTADFNSILKAPSLAAFSQRIRRNLVRYHDEPILLKRLNILKDKRFRFTNVLKFKDAPAYSAPLDRSIRFLDEKLEVSGQFRAEHAIDPMLNAWAIVNNLRAFLPGAQKAGQSLAQFFGAKVKGIPWMEVLNLCTVGTLQNLIPTLS
ncbi:MAG: hypothetical protein HC768_20970 [Acaryochloris sp. CRU_2_0]|nr:hypothetical protein [Acaryochloris sp. CRU_2_0]